VKDGADHTLQLRDHTKVTADVKFEVTLDRNAPRLQVAYFLLDTTGARSEQINGAQLWRLDVQTAWWSGCDDEMSAAMRRFSVTVPNFTEFQRQWSANSKDQQGVSLLDQAAQDKINQALQVSSNCPLRVSAVTVSNIAPDPTTQAFLSQNSQNVARLESVKALLQEYQKLNVPTELRPLAEALVLSNTGKEINIHVGEKR